MLSERETVLVTIAHIRKRRGNAFLWNESFQEQLVQLARNEGLLGPKPGSAGSIVQSASAPDWCEGEALRKRKQYRPITALF